jgi:membrane associated rhomboid family serine protease
MTGPNDDRPPPRRSWTAVALVAVMAIAHAVVVAQCGAGRGAPGATWLESVWTMGSCRAELESAGALAMGRVWIDGEWWRVATAPLLHGSWLHLALNGWSLLELWPWIAATWGVARALGCFALGAVTGCLASLAWAEAPLVVGASGGILALAAALLVARLAGTAEQREVLADVSARALAGSLGALIVLGFAVPIIAQAGHLGGMALGAALARGFGRAPALGGVATAVLVTALALASRQPQWSWRYHEILGLRRLEREELDLGSAALEEALRRRPGDPSLSNSVAYGWAKAGIRLDEAEALVRTALEAEPENPDFRDTLGWILCRRGDSVRGMEELLAAQRGSSMPVPEIDEHVQTCASAAPR